MLQTSRFENVISYSFWDIPPSKISKHAQLKHFPIFHQSSKHACFNTLKWLNLQTKARLFWHGSSFLHLCSVNFNSFGRNCATTFLWLGYFKSMLAYVIIILKIPKIHHVFAQDMPCKFVIALSFDNNTCEESSNNWHFKWPNGFMSPSSIKCQFIRFCPTPRQREITSFPSNGEDPKVKNSWVNRYYESIHFIDTTTCQWLVMAAT